MKRDASISPSEWRARGQLNRDQHLGIETEPVGQAPASSLAVPHREMNRQRQGKPIELRARLERGDAIKRVHAAQLEHDIEQRILDPSTYRLRFSGSFLARRFANAWIRLERWSHRGFDSTGAWLLLRALRAELVRAGKARSTDVTSKSPSASLSRADLRSCHLPYT